MTVQGLDGLSSHAYTRIRHVPRLLVQDPSQPHRKPVAFADFALQQLTSKVDRHEGILPASNSFARIFVQQDGSHCHLARNTAGSCLAVYAASCGPPATDSHQDRGTGKIESASGTGEYAELNRYAPSGDSFYPVELNGSVTARVFTHQCNTWNNIPQILNSQVLNPVLPHP